MQIVELSWVFQQHTSLSPARNRRARLHRGAHTQNPPSTAHLHASKTLNTKHRG